MERQEIALLYETYAQDVFRLALCYLHDRQDAEDICQTVFLKLLDRDVCLLPGREKAWLLTCTANACKNHLKSFWRRNITELDDSIPYQDGSNRDLWEAVMSLAPKYRVCLHLYYYEGYHQDEIARILKLSRTAVQTRISRARELLKKELNEDEQPV